MKALHTHTRNTGENKLTHVQAQRNKDGEHIEERNPRKNLFLLFPASLEDISVTRRAGLKQDVGIAARI